MGFSYSSPSIRLNTSQLIVEVVPCLAAEPYTLDEQTLQRRSIFRTTPESPSIVFGVLSGALNGRNRRKKLKGFAVPEETETYRPHVTGSDAPSGEVPKTLPRRRLESLINRYRGLPPWVLLAQFFLATGWQRAAVTHGTDGRWWDGTVVTQFVADHRDQSIDWYGATMLDGPVATWPVAICVIVFAVQLAVGLMLFFNARPLIALTLGAGLNINFALAGAVNPSIFYLIIGAVLALWHLEDSATPANTKKLASFSTLLSAAALGALLPEIATLNPAHVIDDPAIVLSFAALLWVGALRMDLVREPHHSYRPRRRRPDVGATAGSSQRLGDGIRPVRSRDVRCERLP